MFGAELDAFTRVLQKMRLALYSPKLVNVNHHLFTFSFLTTRLLYPFAGVTQSSPPLLPTLLPSSAANELMSIFINTACTRQTNVHALPLATINIAGRISYPKHLDERKALDRCLKFSAAVLSIVKYRVRLICELEVTVMYGQLDGKHFWAEQ